MGDIGDAKGIGGEPPSKAFEEVEAAIGPTKSGEKGAKEAEDIEGLLHEKVRTLGQLKQVMIQHLGEKEGTKLYNSFMKTLAMQILSQVQHSAEQAKKAARGMREGNV